MKRTIVFLLILALFLSLGASAFAAAVVRSSQALKVDGSAVDCDRYNIDGRNYFKLRDLAYVLNGTGSQFDVSWDEASRVVSITTAHSYTAPDGTELVIGEDKSATAQISPQTIRIDGAVRSDLTAYNIGGSNYFQLRELGAALGFGVDYDEASRTMLVTSRTGEIFTLDSFIDGEYHDLTNEKTATVGASRLSFYQTQEETDGVVTARLYIRGWTNGDPETMEIALSLQGHEETRRTLPAVTTVSGAYVVVEAVVDVRALTAAYGLGEQYDNKGTMSQKFIYDITDSRGRHVTYGRWGMEFEFPVFTKRPEGPDGTVFKFSRGWEGTTGGWRYISGQQVAYDCYFTLCTGANGGTYTMSFPISGTEADVCTFTAEANSVYKITYSYGLSASGSQYSYSGKVSWSGPNGTGGSFDLSFSGGLVKAGYLNAGKQ